MAALRQSRFAKVCWGTIELRTLFTARVLLEGFGPNSVYQVIHFLLG